MTGDLAAARHLAAALRAHRERVQRDGGAVPEVLVGLERLFRVSAGQDGPSVQRVADPEHSRGVTPQLLTFRQAGDALALSERSVKRLIAAGELRAVKIGSATRIRAADVDEFVGGLTGTPEHSTPGGKP